MITILFRWAVALQRPGLTRLAGSSGGPGYLPVTATLEWPSGFEIVTGVPACSSSTAKVCHRRVGLDLNWRPLCPELSAQPTETAASSRLVNGIRD
jgi:hypothetical protein